MLRKLNFTERLRIPRSATHIRLRREDGGLTFDALLSLNSLPLPGDARVFVEAWYRSSFMRFDFGTVGAIREPQDRRLTAIDSSNVVRFRVKVDAVGEDEWRILALADGLTVSERAGSSHRVSLLEVQFEDLGEEVWRVNFDEGGGAPVLEVNNRIDNIESLLRTDPQFFALVYPAAVREIFQRLFFIEEYEPGDDSEEWPALWMKWAVRLAGAPPERDNPYDVRQWIDTVAANFCSDRRAASRLMQSLGAESE